MCSKKISFEIGNYTDLPHLKVIHGEEGMNYISFATWRYAILIFHESYVIDVFSFETGEVFHSMNVNLQTGEFTLIAEMEEITKNKILSDLVNILQKTKEIDYDYRL